MVFINASTRRGFPTILKTKKAGQIVFVLVTHEQSEKERNLKTERGGGGVNNRRKESAWTHRCPHRDGLTAIPCLSALCRLVLMTFESDGSEWTCSEMHPGRFFPSTFLVNLYTCRRHGFSRGLTLNTHTHTCLLYTSPSPRDKPRSRMPSSA